MDNVICAYCGKNFNTENKMKIYCSNKCSRKSRIIHKDIVSQDKEIKNTMEEIISIDAKAKKLGITYGEYTAMQYSINNKIRRNKACR